ncbi:L(+)-tartrate dehydratase subunit beta [Methanobrevibacter cuticularis]|uniref:L(+)-tartrate dehydratase subunit beta n=1 Tax=Methanobrevibacter cuticularis TaxID=47311 RepID=A0A166FL55_9EURY|nr:FumA C-terminus/TtdB family hydratase beta subunit [Methanobrevibacter cuticularis]KZX17789.1 L(+)-tartrate dehydratase subunit beta [Methanobrevibacter cuticularis]
MKKIDTPISFEDMKHLKAGDIIKISGKVLTARDQAHKRIIETEAPCNLEGAAIFHAGPIIKQKNDIKNEDNKKKVDGESSNFQMVAIGPTTSMRMNPYEVDVIKKGVKIIIGKGGMDDNVSKALKDEGAVYLAAVGGCAALYVDSVKKITNVNWLDLGMPEAIWELEVEEFGPLIVAMDSYGNSLFK